MSMPMLRRCAAPLFLAALALGAGAGLANAAPHVRGEITALSGDTVTVKTAMGETVEVTTAPDFAVILYTKIGVADLKPDDYLSIPSVEGADGVKQALAINVFPAAMKGTGEGESPWDMGPDSLMTNATLGTLKTVGSAHAITVTYKGAEETIAVPEGTPISSFAPAPDRKLKVGENVTFFGEEADGAFLAARGGVTEDGSAPPI